VQPEHFYFGGGAAETTLFPIVAILMILTIGSVLVLPRKYVVVPFLLCAFLIPLGQTLVVAGVHFFVLRIVLIFAWSRLFATKLSSGKSLFGGRLETFDKVFLVWAGYHVFASLVLFGFQSAVIVNQCGSLLDLLGGYFLMRYLIRGEEDIFCVIKVFAGIVAVVGLCMLNEKLRGQNLFAYLGAPLELNIRDGAIRAEGPFAHPILAGTFAATLVPLFISLWMTGKAKVLAVVGVAASVVMTFSAASSTPLTAFAGGLLAVFLWPMRKKMRMLRWGIVIVVLAVHLAMKAPVWFLIARVDLTGASSGYHRAMLVDGFIRHFRDWWLVGTTDNVQWGYDMWDLSNQFVAEGVSGGLVPFICFITFISLCFKKIGTARKTVRGDRKREWFLWLLGAALFSHVVGFWGISYFDHTQLAWFALLAMILAATGPASMKKSLRREAMEVAEEDLRVYAALSNSAQPGVTAPSESAGVSESEPRLINSVGLQP
jgi:hypothetical protein